jgi:hypothetical protein
MMSLISQASRQQFIQQSFPAVMRMQGGMPATMPRVSSEIKDCNEI